MRKAVSASRLPTIASRGACSSQQRSAVEAFWPQSAQSLQPDARQLAPEGSAWRARGLRPRLGKALGKGASTDHSSGQCLGFAELRGKGNKRHAPASKPHKELLHQALQAPVRCRLKKACNMGVCTCSVEAHYDMTILSQPCKTLVDRQTSIGTCFVHSHQRPGGEHAEAGQTQRKPCMAKCVAYASDNGHGAKASAAN